MANEQTARDAFNRIRWDARLRPEAFVVGYVDRNAARGVGEKTLTQWEGDIPWHRVLYVRCERFMFWHRDAALQSSGSPPDAALARPEGQAAHRIGSLTPYSRLTPYGESRSLTSYGNLTLYSLNVLSWPDDTDRLDALCHLVRSWDADVVLLQEVTPPLLERLCASLEGWISDIPPGDALHPHGVVIFSRHKFTFETKTLTAHKRAVAARFENGLRVATVHLPSDRAVDAAALRRQYLGDILGWLGEGDVVLAGDLNARGHELEDMIAAHGFRDAWQGDDGFTYDPRVNALARVNSRSGRPARFDRLLVRGTWKVQSMRVMSSAGHSDHEAISAVLDPVSARATPVHRSAIAVIPPRDAWEPIQAIRRRFDRHMKRWMPHINLLYGFIPEDGFEEAVRVLARRLVAIPPFDVTLDDYDFFSHRRDCTAWLRPAPAGPLEALEAALVECFPQCSEQRREGAFTPHLSVGRFASPTEAFDLLPEWTPLTFHVDHVALISRRGDDPFEVRHRVPLGTALDRLPRLTPAARDERTRLVERVREACVGLGVGLEVVGSMRTGTDGPTSDIDAVCYGGGLSRAQFFERLQASLGCAASVAADARIPVLRLSLDWTVEVQYVEGDDEASRHAAQAPEEADALLAAVSAVMPLDRFREVVRRVRAWAGARRIHGHRWGFLGTYSWTVLTAWACVTTPCDGDAPAVFRHVLSMAASLADGDAIGLDVSSFHPGPQDRMPVLTSLPPPRNSATGVTRSTARIMRTELQRAARLAAEGNWTALLEAARPSGTRLEIPADAVPARDIVRLILALEKLGDVRPWPAVSGDFAIGIESEHAEASLAIARGFADVVKLAR